MKLYYFDVYGKGEALRLLLSHSGAEWEDVRLKGETWMAFKPDTTKCEYGQLPILERDGKFLSQSTAILRLLGREHGYYPSDAEAAYRVDNLIDLLEDFRTPLMKAFWIKEEEEKKKAFEDLVANHLPKHFGFWEKKLLENSSPDFLVGDSATIADFAYLANYSAVINNGAGKDAFLPVLDGFPTAKAYFQARWDAQAAYFEARPKCSF